MGTILLQQHTEASEAMLAKGARSLSAFAKRCREASEGADNPEDAATLLAIAEALADDNPRRVQGIEYRHLVPKGCTSVVVSIAREIHGDAIADAMLAGKMCPALAAEGVTSSDAYSRSKINRRDADADMRAMTYRCPICTASDVTRTLRKRGAVARDAARRWNR